MNNAKIYNGALAGALSGMLVDRVELLNYTQILAKCTDFATTVDAAIAPIAGGATDSDQILITSLSTSAVSSTYAQTTIPATVISGVIAAFTIAKASFAVEAALPSIAVVSPLAAFDVSANAVMAITGTYSDNGSPVSSIHILLNGVDVGAATFGGGIFSYTSIYPGASATLTVAAVATNGIGSATSAVISGTVKPTLTAIDIYWGSTLGDPVTRIVTGYGLTGATVKIGSTTPTQTVNSDNQIAITAVPAIVAGAYDVKVERASKTSNVLTNKYHSIAMNVWFKAGYSTNTGNLVNVATDLSGNARHCTFPAGWEAAEIAEDWYSNGHKAWDFQPNPALTEGKFGTFSWGYHRLPRMRGRFMVVIHRV